MIGYQDRNQKHLFIVCSLGDLVPDDHILKCVDKAIDFSWILGEVRNLYDIERGRPSIDPQAALKLMLAGFFLGIVNDRKLMREAQVNLAIRCFAGYSLEDTLPDHSSLTRIRHRWGSETFKKCFRRIVKVCYSKGLISAETVHVDATLIRANVSWDNVVDTHVERVIKVNKYSTRTEKKVEKRILTDPDATLATNSRNHRLTPSYKQHVAVDDQSGVILDVILTTGNINEGDKIISQIHRIEQMLPVKLKYVTADAGYAYGKVFAGFEKKRISAIIPPKRIWANKNVIPLHRFKYDAQHDIVRCPKKKILHKTSQCKHGWYYKTATADCNGCALRNRCLSPKVNRRTVVISDTYPELLRARRKRSKWSSRDYWLYARHRWMVEGVNAEAKCLHGLQRAVRRGIENVTIQSFLTAATINLKRLAKAA